MRPGERDRSHESTARRRVGRRRYAADRQLIAVGHEVVGISRSQATAQRMRTAGAEAVVADVLDHESLLAAVLGVRADAVMQQFTALGTTKMRQEFTAWRGTWYPTRPGPAAAVTVAPRNEIPQDRQPRVLIPLLGRYGEAGYRGA